MGIDKNKSIARYIWPGIDEETENSTKKICREYLLHSKNPPKSVFRPVILSKRAFSEYILIF